MAIAQTGTSLPHALGYALTSEQGLVHGVATSWMLIPWLAQHPYRDKANKMAALLGCADLDALIRFLRGCLRRYDRPHLREEEKRRFAQRVMADRAKRDTYPATLTIDRLASWYDVLDTPIGVDAQERVW